jgi:hypothetical protein
MNKVTLDSDSPISLLFLAEQGDKFRLSLYGERGSCIVVIDRSDLEKISAKIDAMLTTFETI